MSCWDAWRAADKGFYDNIPSKNAFNVVWDPVYYDEGTKSTPWYFAKFLPEVRSEVIGGVPIKREYTQKNFSDTTPLDLATLPTVADNGVFVSAGASKTIPISGTLSGAGKFRIYVEAEGLNIYPYIVCIAKDADGTATYYREINTNINAIRTRGQNSVFSGILEYDFGVPEDHTISALSLYLAFNRIKEMAGTLTPKVRVGYTPY